MFADFGDRTLANAAPQVLTKAHTWLTPSRKTSLPAGATPPNRLEHRQRALPDHAPGGR